MLGGKAGVFANEDVEVGHQLVDRFLHVKMSDIDPDGVRLGECRFSGFRLTDRGFELVPVALQNKQNIYFNLRQS